MHKLGVNSPLEHRGLKTWFKVTNPNFTNVGVNAGNTPVMGYFFLSTWAQEHIAPELQKIPVSIG